MLGRKRKREAHEFTGRRQACCPEGKKKVFVVRSRVERGPMVREPDVDEWGERAEAVKEC